MVMVMEFATSLTSGRGGSEREEAGFLGKDNCGNKVAAAKVSETRGLSRGAQCTKYARASAHDAAIAGSAPSDAHAL